MNENGERFVDFCGLNDFVIGGSIFVYKRIYKVIWVLFDYVMEN